MLKKLFKDKLLGNIKFSKVDIVLTTCFIVSYLVATFIFLFQSDFFQIAIVPVIIIALLILFRSIYLKNATIFIRLLSFSYILLYFFMILIALYLDSTGYSEGAWISGIVLAVLYFPVFGGLQLLIICIFLILQIPLNNFKLMLFRKLNVKEDLGIKHNTLELLSNSIYALLLISIIPAYYKTYDFIFFYIFIVYSITFLYQIILPIFKKKYKKITESLITSLLFFIIILITVSIFLPAKFHNPVKFFSKPLIVDSVVDYPLDSDNNGLFDTIIIEINMTVNLPKEYRIVTFVNGGGGGREQYFNSPKDTYNITISGERLDEIKKGTGSFNYDIIILDWPLGTSRYYYNSELKSNYYDFETDFE